MSQGIRHNEGKPQWSQIDFKSLEPMVRVLEAGEKIVGKSNWKKGLLILEVCESLLRHTFAYMDGEDNDQKSGQPHVGHIMANAMFLSHMHLFRPDMDNREKKEEMVSVSSIEDARPLSPHEVKEYINQKLSKQKGDFHKRYEDIANSEWYKNAYSGKSIDGVLDESNFRQLAEDFANRLRNHKEDPPRIVRPMPEWPPKQSRFEKAIQNAKQGNIGIMFDAIPKSAIEIAIRPELFHYDIGDELTVNHFGKTYDCVVKSISGNPDGYIRPTLEIIRETKRTQNAKVGARYPKGIDWIDVSVREPEYGMLIEYRHGDTVRGSMFFNRGNIESLMMTHWRPIKVA